ncbi:MAG: HAMP domain-containing protein [Pseudohongiella sp.]|nr:HAMP domain-containing protein [Pseudohongiella sp.]
MSFKIKTILLLIIVSLAPYIITMIILGNAYRSDLEARLVSEMEYQLDITISRLDQSLQTLENDLRFIASLDIMNDVFTSDLDQRIFNLLLQKKSDLQLIGDFHVIDNNATVIASSNIERVGSSSIGVRFITIPVYSTFDQSQIAELVVEYDRENLSRLFANDEYLKYSLLANQELAANQYQIEDSLRVQGNLERRPEYTVLLEQDREFAFSILDSLARSFYFTLLIGIVVIAGIAVLVANYIVGPILLLATTARSVTNTQDYSQRVEVKRADEIGQLAGAFNLMISGIQDMLSRLKEESENKIKLAQEKHRTEMLQNLSTKLSKYLSPQIYESIFSGEKDVTLGASRKKLTVFFSDIVNFTSTTDQMESEDLTLLLNQYLNEMTRIALQYGATVDKYIGDAIMIFFGDPGTQGVHKDAQLCVEMAIAMQKRVRELRDEWQAAGFTKPFNIRVGIHTGYCTVGNFGTENRMDYTIIGSAVNLASRIESSAEPETIFISEDTYLLVRDHFDCLPASTVMPKGLSQPIQLYRVQTEVDQSQSTILDEDGFHLRVQPREINPQSKQRIQQLLQKLADDLKESD